MLRLDTGFGVPFLLPRSKLGWRSWSGWITLKVHLFLSGSGSLAAMAVFEDKFRPDMEVRKSLQFSSLSQVFPAVCRTLAS